jgi:hypothetical protein
VNTLISLIKEKPYDKKIDDYKIAECVICFEDFQRGVPIRKLPMCGHIFHSGCIDGWFKAKLSQPVHKCPLCNADVSVEIVREAIKKKGKKKDIQATRLISNPRKL